MTLVYIRGLLRALVPAVLVLVAVGCATTPATVSEGYSGPRPYMGDDPGPQPDWAEAERTLKAIRTYQFGDSREPLAAVHEIVRDAMYSPESSARLAALLADSLEGKGTVDAKRFVCRELSLIGTASQVPQLSALLTDPDLSDSARYALDRIEG